MHYVFRRLFIQVLRSITFKKLFNTKPNILNIVDPCKALQQHRFQALKCLFQITIHVHKRGLEHYVQIQQRKKRFNNIFKKSLNNADNFIQNQR